MGRTPNIAEELDEELIKVYIKNLFSLPTPQVLPIEGEMPEGQRGSLLNHNLLAIHDIDTALSHVLHATTEEIVNHGRIFNFQF